MVEDVIAKFEIGKRGKTESKAEVGKALTGQIWRLSYVRAELLKRLLQKKVMRVHLADR